MDFQRFAEIKKKNIQKGFFCWILLFMKRPENILAVGCSDPSQELIGRFGTFGLCQLKFVCLLSSIPLRVSTQIIVFFFGGGDILKHNNTTHDVKVS